MRTTKIEKYETKRLVILMSLYANNIIISNH